MPAAKTLHAPYIHTPLPHGHASHGPGACCCGSPMLQQFHERVMADLSRRQVLGGTAAVMAMFAGLSVPSVVSAQPRQANGPLLLTNLQLFDGSGSAVQSGVSVRIEEGRIHSILPADATAEGAEVFDCGGRLLMPGLIDAHWHTTLAAITQTTAMTADVGYIHLVAAQEAKRTLMRGVTSVRDVGGPSFALQRAINEGIVDGPRIFPAGAMISQTSGHGDFRMRHDIPRGSTTPLSEQEHQGVAAIADGEDEVLRRTREQLMLGASQIKLMAGGGVASLYDPLDSTQFTERELRAAVDAAGDWGTYVMVHVYTPRGIQRALRAGVKSIEHGQLADEEAARMMAGEGAWWSRFYRTKIPTFPPTPPAESLSGKWQKAPCAPMNSLSALILKPPGALTFCSTRKTPPTSCASSPNLPASTTRSPCWPWPPAAMASCLRFPARATPTPAH